MLIGYVGSFHDRAALYAKESPAFGTPVRLGLVGCRSGFRSLADWAFPAALPNLGFEPFLCGFVVGEHLEELHHGDSFSETLAGCLLAHIIL